MIVLEILLVIYTYNLVTVTFKALLA